MLYAVSSRPDRKVPPPKPSVKISLAYPAWPVQVTPQLEKVAEEGGGRFMDEVCKAQGKAMFPLTCVVTASSSNAAWGCLQSLATKPPRPSSLHMVQHSCITSVFGGKCRGSLCPAFHRGTPGSPFQTEVGIFPEAMSAGVPRSYWVSGSFTTTPFTGLGEDLEPIEESLLQLQ